MPDPLTHLCTALLPAALFGTRHVGVFAMGVSLPDVLSRVPTMALDRLIGFGLPIPDVLLHPWAVLHMPFGALCACVLSTYAFPERDRTDVLAWLAGGTALHLGVDMLQFHHGQGYYLLFPLSMWRFELGWIGSESTVPLAPWLAVATAAAWGARLAWNRSRRAAPAGR